MSYPKNKVAVGSAPGPYGSIAMGGMFTVVKIRDSLANYQDPGWYQLPKGTVTRRVGHAKASVGESYTCSMHPEVHSPRPGKCPKCGMQLVPEKPSESTKPGQEHHH